MSIEIKKIVVDGKALQLKVINQLQPLSVSEDNSDIECLGYYIVKKQKKYIFQTNNTLKAFIDYDYGIAKSASKTLYGNGNRVKSFKSNELRDEYFAKLNRVTTKLVEDQLFY